MARLVSKLRLLWLVAITTATPGALGQEKGDEDSKRNVTARFESTARARVSIRVEPSCLASQFGPGSLDYGHGLVTTDIKINTAKKTKI